MSVDLNIKYPQHPRFDSNQVEVSGDLEILIQQIELLLFTNKGEVIGEEDYGIGLEEYLFKLNVNAKQIASQAEQQIYNEIPEANKFTVKVDGKVYNQASDSVGVFSVEINNSNDTQNLAKIQALVR